MAERISGLAMDLTDAEDLCAYARFCHNKTGRVWDLTERSDDPKLKAEAIKQSGNCPAGRLVAWEKNAATPIEPRLKPSLGLIEDPQKKVSGPLWAKGGIEIVSADGKTYERRNRVTLCRCGQSKNKPFCDGCHASAGFNDGDASLK